MLRDYVKGILGLAFRSSWKAANGLEGAALAGAALIWPGLLPVFIRDESWAPAARWILSFVLYAAAAVIILFVIRLVFIAPFQIWRRDRKVDDLSLEIVYDPINPTYVRPITGLYGQTGEFYSIAIRNPGAKTLYDVSVRALDSWFTRTAIATAQTGHSITRHEAIPICIKDSLHPNAPEIVQLFGIGYHQGSSNPEYIFNTVQRFTLEAAARDAPAIRREFEYDPNARPMLKLLPDA